jgi:hypothetical protein
MRTHKSTDDYDETHLSILHVVALVKAGLNNKLFNILAYGHIRQILL